MACGPPAAMATRREGRGCGDGSPAERRASESIWELAAKGEVAALPARALRRFCAKRMFCVREWRRGASRPQLLALDGPSAAEAVRLLPGWPRAFVLLVSEQRAQVRLLRFTAAAWFHVCAVRIQRAYRRRRALKHAAEHAAKHVESVVCIQALWRGYSWRKKNHYPGIKAIRTRLEIINGEVREEDTLYKRTARALGHLLTCKHLSAILEALKHLEVATRLSPLCCENVAQSRAISKIFALIRNCNRSIPCMEVISSGVQVLLHVAKFEKTTCAVYGVDSCVGTLLELLQIYREKPGDKVPDKTRSIFTKTCCLLAVLLKTAAVASDVRNRSIVVDCVYSLYKHTARQHRVNTERVFYKQNKNSSIRTPFIPETPISTGLVSRLKPGWVLRRDNVDITSPLQAVQMVMDVLGIPY